jgi:hypothetical protein
MRFDAFRFVSAGSTWLLLAALGSFGLAACDATAQNGQKVQGGLDPRLVGTWYWHTYVYTSEYGPINFTSTLRIGADGTFHLREEGTKTGVQVYQGRVVQQGNTLVATTDQGVTTTYRFSLSGSNGLRIGNRLCERR